jgi:hypothetical protein
MKRGNLDRVATAVNQIMDRRYADMPQTVAKRARPLVMTDPRSNCLLIAATEPDFKDIEGLVARIEEQPTDPAVALHVIPVQGVRVETIAPRLQTVMRERMATLGDTARPSDRISIESDLATNTLIVASSHENAEIIKQLIDSLKSVGNDSALTRDFQTIQLKKSRATDIVQLLENMYIREVKRRRGTDSTNAAWSGVAAHDVMRKPASQRRWMPSDAYWKSSSTHWSTKPALRDMTTAHRVWDVAMAVT